MNKNNVELLGYYGSDITHAQSAWTSTSRDIDQSKLERIPALLKMLASEGHHTPFEKSSLHFLVTVDQATHIHILKHRIGCSVNGECLTGDSIITFNDTYGATNKRLKKTVKELFESWNSGRHHQNTEKDMMYNRKRIQKMKLRVLDETTGFFKNSNIKDIWSKGIQKVFKITLDNGYNIKCTTNHSIWTNVGYKTLSDGLSIGSLVGCNGKKRTSNKMHVHYSPVIAIDYIGEEETYDIEVEGVNNNFIANNIVVHNSARYKELKEDKMYLPEDWKDIPCTMDHLKGKDWMTTLKEYSDYGNKLYHKALEDLTPILGRKRAKESARFFKTFNSQISMDVMFNWRSFMHFQELRNSEHAQIEVRELAQDMLKLVMNIEGNPFEHSLKAFNL